MTLLAPAMEQPCPADCAAVDDALGEHLRHDLAIRLQLRTRALRPLYHGTLADSPQVLQVTTDREPLVVIYSAAAQPTSALTAARHAQAARAALGPGPAARVVATLLTGWLAGRTYSVHPLLHPTASVRPLWFLQRLALRPALFAWLREAAGRTCRDVDAQDAQSLFLDALAAVQEAPALPAMLKDRSRHAAARLQQGDWSPAACLMHGDLWQGNILLQASGLDPSDFALIDWAGATLRGFPFVDVVRCAQSLRASPQQLKREIDWHAGALGCAREDACGYLLAWTGSLLRANDAFPAHRIAALSSACLACLDLALDAPARPPWTRTHA